MYNAKVNTTDFGRIVVDQTNRAGVKFTLNNKFLTDLSFNSFLKCLQAECKECVIFIINMSADAKRAFCNQSLLASFFAANVVQNTFSISDYHIRNNLIESWIGFSEGTRHKTIIFFIENRWQVMSDVGVKTLKDPKLFKKRTRKNENIFIGNGHIGLKIQESEFRSQNLGA